MVGTTEIHIRNCPFPYKLNVKNSIQSETGLAALKTCSKTVFLQMAKLFQNCLVILVVQDGGFHELQN